MCITSPIRLIAMSGRHRSHDRSSPRCNNETSSPARLQSLGIVNRARPVTLLSTSRTIGIEISEGTRRARRCPGVSTLTARAFEKRDHARGATL